ncbi:MAG: hypothetical protein ABFD66_09185 [Smithella sp.]
MNKKGAEIMDMSIVMGVARALAAGASGWLIKNGYTKGDETDTIAGAIVLLVTILFSVLNKKKVNKLLGK